MQSQAQMRRQLVTNENVDHLLEVLKQASFIRLSRLQKEQWALPRFWSEIISALGELDRQTIRAHPLVAAAETVRSRLIVLITSDEGFQGGLNLQVVQAGLAQRNGPHDVLVVVGERGCRSLEELEEPFSFFPQLGQQTDVAHMYALQQYLTQQYLERRFSEVVIAHGEFVSVTERRVRLQRVLPFSVAKIGKQSESADRVRLVSVDPSETVLIDSLIRMAITYTLLEIFHSAKLAEHSAKVLQLERSHLELEEQRRRLRGEMFKQAHVIADRRIRESHAAQTVKKKQR